MNLRISRPFVISAAIALAIVAAVLQPDIKNFLWAHSWWRAFFVALPPLIMTAVGVIVQWRQSAKADVLQTTANEQREQANRLSIEANDLRHQISVLHMERNTHLEQIAANTKKERSKAEKNADILRKYIGSRASVTDNLNFQPTTPIIAEINEQDIVALFTPGGSGSQAYCVNAYVGDLDVTEIPEGGCAVRISLIKRHGAVVNLGQITRWEDRSLPAATPRFDKGPMAYNATFTKPGSPDTRWILVFASGDGANSFLLETSTGEKSTGNNEEVSKRFTVLQVEFLAAGFTRGAHGGGGSKHPLFIL
jgi:hypothetical protein